MEAEKLRILREVLGHGRKSNDERLFNCPYCEHHKPKLSVNIEKNVYKCWVCDSRGSNIYHLVRRFGSYKHRQAWLQFEEETDYTSFEDLFGTKEEEEQAIDLPKEYIKRKKLSKEMVKHYYYAKRLRYRLNNYLNKDTVIEEDTIPAGEYNLVEGWNDGPKITVK